MASWSAASSTPLRRQSLRRGLWTLLYDFHEDRSPTHGYEATREAAMAAFAKS
jgi:hypothetical protein